jgi:protocatechuate 3,4-dioxygenase beta subunit
VDGQLERSDIRSDPTDGSISKGVLLRLDFHVSRIDGSGCAPLSDALVHVWQCDALGVYSGVQDLNDRFNTVGQNFLRGFQPTDADGVARFTTIYPGWYEGRTVHIHFTIRTDPSSDEGREFTSQLYFDDRVTDRVMEQEPYASRGRDRDVRNPQDAIYRAGGDQLLLEVEEIDVGYSARFDIGLQLA